LNHNTVDQRQLWVREDDKGRGGFFLRNPFLDLCLRAGSSQGGNVTMAKKSMDDPEFIWVKERGDDWGCLHKISDSEQKLNVGGNGPYNENTPIIQTRARTTSCGNWCNMTRNSAPPTSPMT
jgi:hypothetical protein